MEDERIDEIEESSPQPDAEVDSSPQQEEELVGSEPTEEQGTTDARIPYDRFKEVNEEKNYWRQQAERLSQMSPQPSQQREEADPYAQFQDPQTKLFYQEMDKRMAKLARQVAEEEKAPILRQNEILTQQLAQIQHKMFKTDNNDVVEGSREEQRIAQLISSGIPIQEATWAVMGPKRVAMATSVKQKKQQSKTEMKQKANLVTGTVPSQSGLPKNDNISFKEKMANALNNDWNEQLS